MNTHGDSHTTRAIVAQIAALRHEWHRALSSTAVVLQRQPGHRRQGGPPLPILPRTSLRVSCR